MEKPMGIDDQDGSIIAAPCECHETRLDGAEARLAAIESKIGELIARYNAVFPILQQMPGLVALVEESGKQQIQLGEELKGYVDEVSKILALLQAERNESEKGKADA